MLGLNLLKNITSTSQVEVFMGQIFSPIPTHPVKFDPNPFHPKLKNNGTFNPIHIKTRTVFVCMVLKYYQ